MISPGGRGADGDFVDAAGPAGSIGRERGMDVLSVAIAGFICADVLLNIGAGCEPDCMNSTLIRTVIVRRAPRTTPAASRALQSSPLNTRIAGRPSSGALFSRLARVMALRTVGAMSSPRPARHRCRPR